MSHQVEVTLDVGVSDGDVWSRCEVALALHLISMT